MLKNQNNRSDVAILSKIDIIMLLIAIVLPTADVITDVKLSVILATGTYDQPWQCCRVSWNERLKRCLTNESYLDYGDFIQKYG